MYGKNNTGLDLQAVTKVIPDFDSNDPMKKLFCLFCGIWSEVLSSVDTLALRYGKNGEIFSDFCIFKLQQLF